MSVCVTAQNVIQVDDDDNKQTNGKCKVNVSFCPARMRHNRVCVECVSNGNSTITVLLWHTSKCTNLFFVTLSLFNIQL